VTRWTLKVRRPGGTERSRHDSLADAIGAMQARLDALAPAADGGDERFLGREFPAATLVEARAELRGPRGGHGGVDLHADSSTVAWTGRVRRRAVVPEAGETAYQALARVLEAGGEGEGVG
jgi:hypothetical protein